MPQLRTAAPDDLAAVERLLADAALPTDGVARHFGDFIVADEQAEVVGAIGFEVYADAALLRSAVVAPAHRGKRLGHSLVERLIGEASVRDIDTLYLLTTTAQPFFAGFGFEVLPREQVPTLVKSSVEFRGACPDSAVAMRLFLRED